MVCRLVDQQIVLLRRKQDRKLQLCLLASAERGIGPEQDRLVEPQLFHLALQPPELIIRLHFRDGVDGRCLRTTDQIREIGNRRARGDLSLIGICPAQQAKQRCFSAPVASDKAESPAGVDLEAGILKNRLVASIIGKRQIFDVDQ